MTLDDRLWKTFNKALGQYQLIDDDDRILVGLSGGKDSMLLLEFLARRSHILKPRFSVEALHVRMQLPDEEQRQGRAIYYETDTSYLQTFCNRLGVPLHIITTHFETALNPQSSTLKSHKPPCFLCSWQRRKMLFNTAQELGCTKIALGHHQDDFIHTALMNLTFLGQFSSMTAKMPMRKMPLTIIRPLCLCHEDDIRQYAEAHHYQKQLKLCPYEHDTNRHAARELFEHMERMNPDARHSIWHALEAKNA